MKRVGNMEKQPRRCAESIACIADNILAEVIEIAVMSIYFAASAQRRRERGRYSAERRIVEGNRRDDVRYEIRFVLVLFFIGEEYIVVVFFTPAERKTAGDCGNRLMGAGEDRSNENECCECYPMCDTLEMHCTKLTQTNIYLQIWR